MSVNNIVFKYQNGKFVISEGYGSVRKKSVKEGEFEDMADNIAAARERGGEPQPASTTPAPAPAPTSADTDDESPYEYPAGGNAVTDTNDYSGFAGEAPTGPAGRTGLSGEVTDMPDEPAVGGSSAPVTPEAAKAAAEEVKKIDPNTPLAHIANAGKATGKEIKNVLPNIENWLKSKGIFVLKDKLYAGTQAPGIWDKIKTAVGMNKDKISDEPITADGVATAAGRPAGTPRKQPSPEGPDRDKNPYADSDARDEDELEELQESKYFYPRNKQKIVRHHSLVPYRYRG